MHPYRAACSPEQELITRFRQHLSIQAPQAHVGSGSSVGSSAQQPPAVHSKTPRSLLRIAAALVSSGQRHTPLMPLTAPGHR